MRCAGRETDLDPPGGVGEDAAGGRRHRHRRAGGAARGRGGAARGTGLHRRRGEEGRARERRRWGRHRPCRCRRGTLRAGGPGGTGRRGEDGGKRHGATEEGRGVSGSGGSSWGFCTGRSGWGAEKSGEARGGFSDPARVTRAWLAGRSAVTRLRAFPPTVGVPPLTSRVLPGAAAWSVVTCCGSHSATATNPTCVAGKKWFSLLEEKRQFAAEMRRIFELDDL
jgi:hypothetical protein